MSTLRLAANHVRATGAFDYGHLQVVFDDGSFQNELEVQAPPLVLAGDWRYPSIPRDHTDTDNTPYYGEAGDYSVTTIDLGGRDAEDVWNILVQVRNQFASEGADINYDTDKNSNSFIRSLLYTVGINVTDLTSRLLVEDIDSFPGVQTNVLLLEEDAFSLNLLGTARNDTIRTGIRNDVIKGEGGADTLSGGDGDDTLTGGGENDVLNGDAGLDTAIYTGSCLDYNLSRAADGKVTISHVRGSKVDGTDILTGVEIAKFADHEIDLTLPTLVGCTELSFVNDFVVGTTRDTQIVFDLERLGDTSYAIQVFVDGRVTTGNAFFNDFTYTIQPGSAPQLIIGASVAEAFGDVAFDFEISLTITDVLAPFIEITDGTAGGVLIGDRVDNPGGRTWGDPHLISFDNVAFDFQAAGEFVLTRATSGPEYEVQARFVPISSAVSVTQAMATRIGDTVVSIEAGADGGVLRIGGVVTSLASGSSLTIGAGSVSRNGANIEIANGSGDITSVDVFSTFINVSPGPAESRALGTLEGLFGNKNGTPADDFRLADGTVLTTPIPTETLYGAFADSWLVDPVERLLPGEVQPFEAPDRVVTVDSLPAALRAAAEAVVDEAGISNELIREAAILDFALTGNHDFIEAAVLTDQSFDPIVDTIPVDPVSSPVLLLTTDGNVLDEEDADAGTATLTVSRGAAEGELTVFYTISGTGDAPASAGNFLGGVLSGSVTIAEGEEMGSFTITVANDNVAEGLETFDVVIMLGPEDADAYEILVSSVSLSIEDGDEPEDDVNPIVGDDNGNSLSGTNGRDYIQGLSGRDKLFGGAGDDILAGGAGGDELTGGEGADVFRFIDNAPSGQDTPDFSDSPPGWPSRDVIRDFNVGEDRIDLTSVLPGPASLVDDYTGGGLEIRQNVYSPGWVLLSLDYDGDTKTDMQINVFTGGTLLTVSDFVTI